MPSLSKYQVNVITTAVKNKCPSIPWTSRWQALCDEFQLGDVQKGEKIRFSHQDYQMWRKILIAECGYDPTVTILAGNRTDITKYTHHDKWSKTSELAKRASVTCIGGDLVTSAGRSGVISGVDYKVDIETLRIDDYDAVLWVENYESFIFVHQFQLLTIGHALVLYRGHDLAARAANTLLAKARSTPVIGFMDPDPSGLGLLIDNKYLTHALIPDTEHLADAPSLTALFGKQLAARPGLKVQCQEKSKAFQQYANWLISTGFATSQEWLCSNHIPLYSIPMVESAMVESSMVLTGRDVDA